MPRPSTASTATGTTASRLITVHHHDDAPSAASSSPTAVPTALLATATGPRSRIGRRVGRFGSRVATGTLNRVARATIGSTAIEPTSIAAPSAAPSAWDRPGTAAAKQTAVAAAAAPRDGNDRPNGLHSSARSSAVWTNWPAAPRTDSTTHSGAHAEPPSASMTPMNATNTMRQSRMTSTTRPAAVELEKRINDSFRRLPVVESVELLVEQFPGGSVLGDDGL